MSPELISIFNKSGPLIHGAFTPAASRRVICDKAARQCMRLNLGIHLWRDTAPAFLAVQIAVFKYEKSVNVEHDKKKIPGGSPFRFFLSGNRV